tara:strand:- start:774 stop:980 length:207 start_codon:yes stop_codon:yes gene_type:complete
VRWVGLLPLVVELLPEQVLVLALLELVPLLVQVPQPEPHSVLLSVHPLSLPVSVWVHKVLLVKKHLTQ